MAHRSSTSTASVGRRRLLRSGLAGLIAAPLFVHDLHAGLADVLFALGVASGQPRTDGMVLWTRLTGHTLPEVVPVAWEVADSPDFALVVARGTEHALAGWGHSVHAEPVGLAPGRWYWYRFTALGQRSVTGRTRTAPAAEASTTLNFAIASCQRWDQGQYAAWRDMATRELDLVMFLGDYIYEYGTSKDAARAAGGQAGRAHSGSRVQTLDQYRQRYALYKSDLHLQAAHAACPWLIIWDDHEVENDYAGGQGTTLSGADFQALRARAYQAWWEHMPVPAAMRPVGPDMRIYHRLDWGRLARIHAVDDRQYRAVQACPPWPRRWGAGTVNAADCPELRDPARTLLGTEQEHWLAQGWDLSRPWNLLAQQTLMTRLTRDRLDGLATGRYSTDAWDGYAPARARLLGTLVERRVPNTVVLGGDVHASYVADLKVNFDDPKAAVVASEFCGTSISSHGPAQSAVDQRVRLNPHIHHGRGDARGYTVFSLDAARLQARLMVVAQPNDDNSPVTEDRRFTVEAGRPGPQRG